jgi:hypothetical protein
MYKIRKDFVCHRVLFINVINAHIKLIRTVFVKRKSKIKRLYVLLSVFNDPSANMFNSSDEIDTEYDRFGTRARHREFSNLRCAPTLITKVLYE